MSRHTFLIVLALMGAAYAEDYAFNQIYELVDRIELCLAPVPERGFSYPATDCKYKARDNIKCCYSKESQADFIASCLLNYRDPVNATIVATAKECLTESLAKPVQPALQKAAYSAGQRDEIGSRIKACQTAITDTNRSSPASDCRNDALIQAQKGYPKESLVDFIIPCLTGKNIPAEVVAEAKTCIVASLAQPLRTETEVVPLPSPSSGREAAEAAQWGQPPARLPFPMPLPSSGRDAARWGQPPASFQPASRARGLPAGPGLGGFPVNRLRGPVFW